MTSFLPSLRLALIAVVGCSSSSATDNPCTPTDQDGISAGAYSFAVTVTDDAFVPRILKSQNLGNVTLTITNGGTKPHDFVLGCIPVVARGCPPSSCFPDAANVATLAPGASATTTFTVPYVEGIYDFRSDISADSTLNADGTLSGLWGQYVVQ